MNRPPTSSEREAAARVAADLEAAATLDPGLRQAVLVRLAAAQVAVAAGMLQPSEPDRLIRVEELAGRLGLSVDYVRHYGRQPPPVAKSSARVR